jgi:hypothetical protein
MEGNPHPDCEDRCLQSAQEDLLPSPRLQTTQPAPPPSPRLQSPHPVPLPQAGEGDEGVGFRSTQPNLPVSPEVYRLQEKFWRQVELCQAEILEGPGKTLRWGVPDGRRDPESGEWMHDDLLISAALCGVLDSQAWGLAVSQTTYFDPLAGLEEVY